MPPITRSQIGYKKLQGGWIAKLQIIGQNNEHRKDIVNSQTAKYRCDKALVLEIFRDKKNVVNQLVDYMTKRSCTKQEKKLK
jgi:hypothetical protein